MKMSPKNEKVLPYGFKLSGKSLISHLLFYNSVGQIVLTEWNKLWIMLKFIMILFCMVVKTDSDAR